MTTHDFAMKILAMSVAQQEKFFENLKKELSEEDYQTTMNFIGLTSMFTDVQKYEAVKNAVCDKLCEEFYGHIVEKRKTDTSANPVYMTSIL